MDGFANGNVVTVHLQHPIVLFDLRQIFCSRTRFHTFWFSTTRVSVVGADTPRIALSGGSGRLDTRLDTPTSTKRRHPDSGIARAARAEDAGECRLYSLVHALGRVDELVRSQQGAQLLCGRGAPDLRGATASRLQAQAVPGALHAMDDAGFMPGITGGGQGFLQADE